MKKIAFVTNSKDLTLGSYRIWINDLNHWFKELGIKSKICHSQTDLFDSDIIICGKNDFSMIPQLKNQHPSKKIGVINLASDKKNLPVDFVIIGSLEEKISLSHYDNVFLFPLIEKMFQDITDYKKHEQTNILRIGYHGNYTHLSKFEPHLRSALEKFNKLCDIELLIITDNLNFKWKHGRPKLDIIMKKWSLNSIKKDLLSCDIGVVPNITCLDDLNFPTSVDKGLYNTDFVARFKNKSNAGRSFVFHQLGIPVVADLTPSNFHIMGSPKNGFIAYNENSWFKSLKKLRNYELRQNIADNAKKEFDRLYDPYDWALRLFKNIGGLK